MNIKKRIEYLESKHGASLCLCAISDLPELLTMRTLPAVCHKCGGGRTEKQIERFAEMQIEGDKRIKIVSAQYAARNA